MGRSSLELGALSVRVLNALGMANTGKVPTPDCYAGVLVGTCLTVPCG
jgi:hypothetical protein